MAQLNHLLYQKYVFFCLHQTKKNYFQYFNILFYKIQIYFYTLLRIVIVVMFKCESFNRSLGSEFYLAFI